MKKKTALFPARFQPLHKGHVHALKQLFKKYHVIIAIGSVGNKNSKNPFSFKQRKKMVETALKDYKGKYRIIHVFDYPDDNKKWTKEVEKKAKFDIVVSGNALVRYCFRRYGSRNYKIIFPSFLRPRIYDASRIREMMKRKLEWFHLVPEKIVSLIKKKL